ncbi:MAG: hypothetical protein KBD25_01220 [Rickettsiaceae bacterium]|nr:hypothetical protein [Rickettsiaceae bacterium]
MIDICTVNYYTDDLINENISRFTANIIIGENTPYKFKKVNQVFIDGTSQNECKIPYNNIKQKPAGRVDPAIHHARTLERCIEYSKSRFLVLLDPDFFITCSLDFLIDYMIDKNLAVLGAPHGFKSIHTDTYRYNEPAINLLPGCFFTIIDRNIYKEKIKINPYDSSRLYNEHHGGVSKPYQYDLIDAPHPFRQTLHKYKWESFRACISEDCSLCKNMLGFKPSKFLERFFLSSHYIAAHIHMRKNTTSYRPKHTKINHGNLFV